MAKSSILGFVEAIGRRLRDQYPDPAPPVLKVDPKKGTEYMAKGETPMTREIMDARSRIDADIKAGNYDPYFPLEQRFYADPSKYDIPGNTRVDAMPKKQATIDARTAEFDTPEARAALNQAFDRSADDPLARDWYAMGQLEKVFIDELGEDAGRQAFKEMFADSMAATTGGADPGSNLLMAAYGNYLRQAGIDVPDAAYKMPVPIGGRYVTGNMKMFDKVINQGEGLTTAGQPKRFNFSANFLGDTSRATIDEQMTRGMTGGKLNAPPSNAYGIMENIVADEAAKRGINPANFQDVSWAGFKGIEGKPMIQFVNEAIERTARLTGQTQDEVAKGLARGKPLYDAGGGLIAAGTVLGMLGASQESQASSLQDFVPSSGMLRSAADEMRQQNTGDAQALALDTLMGFFAPTRLAGREAQMMPMSQQMRGR